jgi:hypothetical protein
MACAGVCRGMRVRHAPAGCARPPVHPTCMTTRPPSARTLARMFVPPVATWVPTALGLALAGGILWLGLWIQGRGGGPDGDEPDSDSDGGGGWGSRRPRRPPPVGPVSWQDFERQFAAYVERCGADGGPERTRTGVGDNRAPNAQGRCAPPRMTRRARSAGRRCSARRSSSRATRWCSSMTGADRRLQRRVPTRAGTPARQGDRAAGPSLPRGRAGALRARVGGRARRAAHDRAGGDRRADGARTGVQWAASIEVITGRRLALVVVLSTSRLGPGFRRGPRANDAPAPLTPREREVVRLIAGGGTAREIADDLQEQRGDRLAERLRRRPHEHHEEDHGQPAPSPRRLAEVRRKRPPHADGPAHRPGEPRGERGHGAIGDRRPGDALQQRRLDPPDGRDRRPD